MGNKKYNILHINTFSNGGAWIAAHRLHSVLKKRGHNSKILTKINSTNDEDVYQYPFSLYERIRESLSYRISKQINTTKTISEYNFFNKNETKNKFNTSKIIDSSPFKPDIIILHWISQFISSKNIYQLSKHYNIPIIWYALDMSPLTGGCHYAWDCNRYTQNCGNCPALVSSSNNDLSNKNLVSKKKYLSNTNIKIIASTPWLQNQISKSSLFEKKENDCVLIGIDENTFIPPASKDEVKKEMKLPSQKKIALIGASQLSDKRKGIKNILNSLNLLSQEEKNMLHIVLFGTYNSSLSDAFNQTEISISHFNATLNEKQLAKVYQMCDFFISASVEDSGPMMINEAIMTGLPVVSFNMGIAPTLIEHKKNGYLAKLKDNTDLALGIKYILNLDENSLNKMGITSRKLGLDKLSVEKQSELFEKIFDNLINGK